MDPSLGFCGLDHTLGSGFDDTLNNYYYGLYSGELAAETSFLDLNGTLDPQGYICEEESEL